MSLVSLMADLVQSSSSCSCVWAVTVQIQPAKCSDREDSWPAILWPVNLHGQVGSCSTGVCVCVWWPCVCVCVWWPCVCVCVHAYMGTACGTCCMPLTFACSPQGAHRMVVCMLLWARLCRYLHVNRDQTRQRRKEVATLLAKISQLQHQLQRWEFDGSLKV